jgi:hypothetical protein
MFDTLTIVTECTIPEEGLNRMKDQRTRVAYLNPGEDDDVTTFSYHLWNDTLMPILKYNMERGRATITIHCCSYFMFGYRMKRMEDSHIHVFLEKLQQAFINELSIVFAWPVAEWKVRKGDAYFDFIVSDTGAYVQAISQGSLSRYKPHNYPFMTAAFECNSRDIKFYDKRAKLISDGCCDERDLTLSKNILRYEVQVISYDMKSSLGCQNISAVMTDTFVNKHLEEYLRRLNMFNLVISTKRQIFRTLKSFYDERWAITLLGDIVRRTNGIHMENGRQERKYLKMIAEAGLAPVLGKMYLPPLLLPWMKEQVTQVREVGQIVPLIMDTAPSVKPTSVKLSGQIPAEVLNVRNLKQSIPKSLLYTDYKVQTNISMIKRS